MITRIGNEHIGMGFTHCVQKPEGGFRARDIFNASTRGSFHETCGNSFLSNGGQNAFGLAILAMSLLPM